MADCPEEVRLAEDAGREKNWKRWGPYLAERQWGTVREDYSPDGSAWSYFPHEHARSRAYRWGEDGLMGICDRECRLCFSVALWNGQDSILKERLFGLSNEEGNHGEDVKELYSYLDSTPTHSYMKALYRYPQGRFPYELLVEENRRRSRSEPEFELPDTGIFEGNRYFDVTAEYAKAGPDDLLVRLTAHNRGPEAAQLHLLPTLWFRNTWTWGCRHEGCTMKPRLAAAGPGLVAATHESLGRFTLRAAPGPDGALPTFLFTENETNSFKLYGVAAYSPYVKDAFHELLVNGKEDAVNPKGVGTKVAAHYLLDIPAGGSAAVTLRLSPGDALADPRGPDFDRIFAGRAAEAEEFYERHLEPSLPPEERQVSRLAYAGLLWSRQFYHLVVEDWLRGDPAMPPPPQRRRELRNADWGHLFCRDVLSVPDKWEYPWFAAWDLAFHMVPMARIDPDFAKRQLILMLREWYQHPNGAMPAYEYNFSDVNPPVHAWACWRVYKIDAARGRKDRNFLASAFQKLLVNFTWWVNRKDASGRHIFSGGFLGLDNIGVFDRSLPLPGGGVLEQADATAWMAFYAGTMFSMALELAAEDPVYQDMASKFFEHFIAIADAMNQLGGSGLWHEQDGFYYDQLSQNGQSFPLRVRSMVGLIPLLAVEAVHSDRVDRLPGFKRRMLWFVRNRRDLAARITFMKSDADGGPPEGAHAPGDALAGTPGAGAAPDARRVRVPLALRDQVVVQGPCGVPVFVALRRGGARRGLRPGGFRDRALRRQRQLARPGLVPGELPARRGLGALPSFLRRQLHGGIPHQLGAPRHAGRGGGGLACPPGQAFRPRPRRALPLPWRRPAFHRRPPLEGRGLFPRVLRRRHRPGLGRVPPDRLDRAGRLLHRPQGKESVFLRPRLI